MSDDEVQNDDHLPQIAAAQAKAAKPTVDRSNRNSNKNSWHIDFGDLKEQLKTPTVAVLYALNGLLALTLILMAFYFGGEIATARADSQEAKAFGHQAEREARIAEDKYQELRVQVGVIEGIIESYGLPRPKRKGE